MNYVEQMLFNVYPGLNTLLSLGVCRGVTARQSHVEFRGLFDDNYISALATTKIPDWILVDF